MVATLPLAKVTVPPGPSAQWPAPSPQPPSSSTELQPLDNRPTPDRSSPTGASMLRPVGVTMAAAIKGAVVTTRQAIVLTSGERRTGMKDLGVKSRNGMIVAAILVRKRKN